MNPSYLRRGLCLGSSLCAAPLISHWLDAKRVTTSPIKPLHQNVSFINEIRSTLQQHPLTVKKFSSSLITKFPFSTVTKTEDALKMDRQCQFFSLLPITCASCESVDTNGKVVSANDMEDGFKDKDSIVLTEDVLRNGKTVADERQSTSPDFTVLRTSDIKRSSWLTNVYDCCHIFFAWTVFGSLWISAIAFPAVFVSKLFTGTWVAVAKMVSMWVCAVAFDLPVQHEIRQFLVRGLHKWFPHIDILYEEEPRFEKTIFCVHPHGIFGIGFASLVDDLTSRLYSNHSTSSDTSMKYEMTLVAAPFLRWCSPIFKWALDLCGVKLHGAGGAEFKNLLRSGNPCALIPGGFHEAMVCG